jgi:hypothetical protein
LQLAPFAGRPVKLYAAGLANGALITTGEPPQEFVIVSVPLAGAFEKVTFPLTSY